MAVITATGNKVVWNALERVDMADIVAMGDLPLRAVASMGGALVGSPGEGHVAYTTSSQNGLLSKLTYDGADPTAVTIGTFMACYVLEADAGPDGEGAVRWLSTFTYDLTTALGATLATQSLDFSAHDGGIPYVWARRVQIESDEEFRRRWNDVDNKEETASMVTRTREYVELGLSEPGVPEQPPDPDFAWVKIARATSVNLSGVVVLEPRYAFDRFDAVTEADATSIEYGKGAKFYAKSRTSDGPGLTEIVTAAFATLAKIMDGRWVIDPDTFTVSSGLLSDLVAWYDNLDDDAYRGLKQVHAALDATAAYAVAVNDRLVTVETVVPLYALVFKWNSGTSQYDILGQTPDTFGVATVAGLVVGAGHRATVTLTVPNGYTIFGVQVDGPAAAFTDALDGTEPPIDIRWAFEKDLPFVGDGVDTAWLQVIRLVAAGAVVSDTYEFMVTLFGTRS